MSLLSAYLLTAVLMPQLPPGQQIPGTVTGPQVGQFPQWGADPKNSKTIRANNNAEKITDISLGYIAWFPSQSAAQGFNANQKSILGSGGEGTIPNPLSGVDAIGDFFNRLSQANTWIRVGEFLAGALILYIGLKSVVAPEGSKVATRNAHQTVRSVVEHTTPAGRAERAARAVRRRRP